MEQKEWKTSAQRKVSLALCLLRERQMPTVPVIEVTLEPEAQCG